MVDWSIARQAARLAAGSGTMPADLGVDLISLSREMEGPVASYTGLELAAPVPPAELVSREEWAGSNLDTLSDLLDPVAARVWNAASSSPGPWPGLLRLGASATLAAEAGLVIGYALNPRARPVRAVAPPARARPRLLYVAPNLHRAVRQLDVDRDSFFGWIVIHELTHAFQFQGVSWLRDHLRRLIREYLDTVEVRIESGAAGGLPSLPSPARIVEAFRRAGWPPWCRPESSAS